MSQIKLTAQWSQYPNGKWAWATRIDLKHDGKRYAELSPVMHHRPATPKRLAVYPRLHAESICTVFDLNLGSGSVSEHKPYIEEAVGKIVQLCYPFNRALLRAKTGERLRRKQEKALADAGLLWVEGIDVLAA